LTLAGGVGPDELSAWSVAVFVTEGLGGLEETVVGMTAADVVSPGPFPDTEVVMPEDVTGIGDESSSWVVVVVRL
jgi:hypothetical protein